MKLEFVEHVFADAEPDPEFPAIMATVLAYARTFWSGRGAIDLDLAWPEVEFWRVYDWENFPGSAQVGQGNDLYRGMAHAGNAVNETMRANGLGGIPPRGAVRVTVAPMRNRPTETPDPYVAFAAPLWIVGQDDNYRRWYEPSDGGSVVMGGGRDWTNLRRELPGGQPFSIFKPILLWAHRLAHELGHAAGVAHHNNSNSPAGLNNIDCSLRRWLMCGGAAQSVWAEADMLPLTATYIERGSWVRPTAAGPTDIWGDADFGRGIPSSSDLNVKFNGSMQRPRPDDGEEPPVTGVLTINRQPFADFDGREVEIGDRIVVDFEPVAPGEQAAILHDGRLIGNSVIDTDAVQKLIIAQNDNPEAGSAVHEIRAIVIRGTDVEPERRVQYAVRPGTPPEPPPSPEFLEPTIDGDPWSAAEGRIVLGAVTLDFPNVPANTRVSFRAVAAGRNAPPLTLGEVIDSEDDLVRWNTDTDDLPDGATIVRATRLTETPSGPIIEAHELNLVVDNTGEPPEEPEEPGDDVLREGVEYVTRLRFERPQ